MKTGLWRQPEGETTEECCLLVIPRDCSVYCLRQPGTTCPGVTPATVGCALPSQALIEKMSPQTCLQPSTVEMVFSEGLHCPGGEQKVHNYFSGFVKTSWNLAVNTLEGYCEHAEIS